MSTELCLDDRCPKCRPTDLRVVDEPTWRGGRSGYFDQDLADQFMTICPKCHRPTNECIQAGLVAFSNDPTELEIAIQCKGQQGGGTA